MNEFDKEVYMIFKRGSSQPEGVYSRAYHNEYEFASEAEARGSNCHDIYQDKDAYDVKKYRVIYEEIK